MDERLLRQAAAHGPEFVREVLELEDVLQGVAAMVAKAYTQGQEGYALAPPPAVPHPDTHPHALPPT